MVHQSTHQPVQATQSLQADRPNLEWLLQNIDGAALKVAMQQPWLNELLPGISKLAGCDQGRECHFEGDVAVHTAMVFDNMKRISYERLGRAPTFVELLSAVMHDLRKPDTRIETAPGIVSFPGHEFQAAAEVNAVARKLGLSPDERSILDHTVRWHGVVHSWRTLGSGVQKQLLQGPEAVAFDGPTDRRFATALALLQSADAQSCLDAAGNGSEELWSDILSEVS